MAWTTLSKLAYSYAFGPLGAGFLLSTVMGSKTPVGTSWAKTVGRCLSFSCVMQARCERSRGEMAGFQWRRLIAVADSG